MSHSVAFPLFSLSVSLSLESSSSNSSSEFDVPEPEVDSSSLESSSSVSCAARSAASPYLGERQIEFGYHATKIGGRCSVPCPGWGSVSPGVAVSRQSPGKAWRTRRGSRRERRERRTTHCKPIATIKRPITLQTTPATSGGLTSTVSC